MIPVLLALGVAVAGGIGAAARMVLDGAITAATRIPYPVGTTVVNVTGSLLLGVVTGLASGLGPWALVLGTGLLGGYTTFSTASFETVRLVESSEETFVCSVPQEVFDEVTLLSVEGDYAQRWDRILRSLESTHDVVDDGVGLHAVSPQRLALCRAVERSVDAL